MSDRKHYSMGMYHDYTPDELEFMNAMDKFKRDHRKPCPDCKDILAVAHSLGYRKNLVADFLLMVRENETTNCS